MAQLEAMGFSKVRCEKALYNTGNAEPEAAMNWLFAHMEDPDIDTPLGLARKPNAPSNESIEMVCQMGFTRAQAKRALKEANGNVEVAVGWIFEHIDEPIPEDEDEVMTEASTSPTKKEDPGSKELPANFELASIVCHKGGSVHAGHYVAFIKKDLTGVDEDGGQGWVLFNDEKVVRSGDAEEMKKFAYVNSYS